LKLDCSYRFFEEKLFLGPDRAVCFGVEEIFGMDVSDEQLLRA